MISIRRRTRISARVVARWLRGRLDLPGLLGLHPEALDDLAWQAHRRFQAGQFDEAGRIYDLMDLLDPRDPRAPLGLGACRQSLGDLPGAERQYDRALTLAPDDPYALADRAEVRLLTGRPDDARPDLARALVSLDRDDGPPDLRQRVNRLRELADRSPSRG